MDMIRVLWQICFCLCGLSATFATKGVLNPNNVDLTPVKIYLCPDFEQVIKFDFNFHDGVIDMEFDLEEDLTDIYQGKLNVSKWVDDHWKEGTFNTSDRACDLVRNYCGEAWKKFRNAVTPAISGDCLMESGHYKISDFEVWRKDVTFTVTDLGLFQGRIILLDEVDTELFCIIIEVEVSEK